jgi:hypothetical protein
VAKTEFRNPNPDDLGKNLGELSGDEAELGEAELLEGGEAPVGDLADFSAEEVAAEPAEADLATEPAGPVHADEEEEEEELEKEPSKLPLVLEVVAILGLPVAIIALALLQLVDAWSGLYLFLLGCVPYALWKGRATNTVFTVFLGLILAAELTAIFCLFKEFQRYGYDVSGRAAKHKITMAAPNYPGAIEPESLA